MKTILKIGVATGIFLVLCGWSLVSVNHIQKAQWLVGTWENKTLRGSIYETWKKAGENEMLGKSYMLNAKDTIVFETVRLVEKSDNLYYIPVVEGQNGGHPVSFALKTITDDMMVFENLQHDFPQRISYQKAGNDALLAEISNEKRDKKQTFAMKKIK